MDRICKSDTFHIQKGVLSPLLFTLYMNIFLDKMQGIPGLVVRAYDDDILHSTHHLKTCRY